MGLKRLFWTKFLWSAWDYTCRSCSRVEKAAQRAVEYPLFKHKSSRRGVDMEHKISQVKDTVPGTLTKIIWWELVK